MRMMLKARMATSKANKLARDGVLGRTIEEILSQLKPEAAYFTDDKGCRTGYLFIEVHDSSEIPKIAEPWFLALDAEIEFHPVMNTEDFHKADAFIREAGKRY